MKITLQATSAGDGREAGSFKDRRSFTIDLSRKEAARLLDKCEVLFTLPQEPVKALCETCDGNGHIETGGSDFYSDPPDKMGCPDCHAGVPNGSPGRHETGI